MSGPGTQGFDEDSARAFLEGVGPQSQQQGGAPAAPSQDTSWLRYPKLALNAVVGGLDQLAGLPGTINDLGTRATFAGLNLLTGSNVQPEAPDYPTGQNLLQLTNKLGLTDRPEAIPTTPLERYSTAGVEGAIGGVIGGPLGIGTGALGGLAGEGARQAFPDNPYAPAIAGTIAGLGFGGGVGATRNALTGRALARGLEGAQNALANSEQNLAAASDAKYFAPRQQETLVAAHNANVDSQIGDMASQLGISRNMQDAGGWLQAAARDWKNSVMPQRLAELRAPLDAAVPADTPVELSNYSTLLKSINSRAGDMQGSADVLTQSGPKALLAALRQRAEKAGLGAPDDLKTAELPGPPTTWANARALRSMVGDALANPTLVKGIGQQNLEKLYNGLSKDLGAAARQLGAEDVWDTYNAGSTQLYKFAQGPLSKIISSDSPLTESIPPEKAAAAALSGSNKGGSTLAALREEIPEGVNELAAAHLQNPSDWNKLSPEAKAALLPGAGAPTVDALLGSKLEAAAAAKNAVQQAGDLQRAAAQARAAAVTRVALAKDALAQHQAAQTSVQNDLTHRMLGAVLGEQALAHVAGGNPLMGALAGYAIPAGIAAIRRGTGYALSPNQLMLPAIGALGGAAAGGQSNPPGGQQ